MTVSQNGYRAGDGSLIATSTIPGTSVRISLRKGDITTVLLHFATWFDTHIQLLRQADTGGYNYRPIAGSTSVSNHGSGTAMDLRWNDHPLGAAGTFTPPQATAIRKQLAFYEGVIRWGGDYSSRKDEMHFEINRGLSEVSRIATKISQEDDMPTVEEIWKTDGLVNTPSNGSDATTNPKRTPAEALTNIEYHVRATEAALTAQGQGLLAAIKALAAKDQVDEAALAAELAPGVAALVIAQLPAGTEVTPEELQTAIVGALRELAATPSA